MPVPASEGVRSDHSPRQVHVNTIHAIASCLVRVHHTLAHGRKWCSIVHGVDELYADAMSNRSPRTNTLMDLRTLPVRSVRRAFSCPLTFQAVTTLALLLFLLPDIPVISRSIMVI